MCERVRCFLVCIAPPTKQFLHVFAKEAAGGTNADRTVYGAASASASSFVVHHTQQISMAAVAGDAENINKQARKMRTNWVTNKQTADGFLRSAVLLLARRLVSHLVGATPQSHPFLPTHARARVS